MITGVIIAIFLVICVLMYLRKLSALFALPLMAFLIALVSGIPFGNVTAADGTVQPGILTLLFVNGPVRLAANIMMLVFGAILAQFIKNTGIAETIVRKVSELAGDRPLVLGIAFMVVLSLLFTTLGGLGAVIMVGTIAIPIMTSVGISAATAGCILLFALSTGGIFNLTNWGLYINTFGLTVEQIRVYAFPLGGIFLLTGILFVIIETKFGGKITALGKGALAKGGKTAWPVPDAAAGSSGAEGSGRKVNVLALLTPLIPFPMVLILKTDIITGFVVAILFGMITTISRNTMKDLTKAVTQGIADSAGAIFLMIGIGMLLLVVMDARVIQYIGPQISSILPSNGVLYVIFFAILAPLALYRGPLNVWGLGLGIGALMAASGRLSGLAIMAALLSTGQLQGICDPTNTHNVWTADFVGTDVNDILRKTLPYVWGAAGVGLIVAGFMFF
jgi:H+/gluconate symporter-like permease